MTISTHIFEGSSILASGEYNDETEEMTITFANGKDYIYIDVPKRTWDELISANMLVNILIWLSRLLR